MIRSVSVGGEHRIGEFARRVGVTPELLRAWEQRYGLLRPVRTAGGFRLTPGDEEDAERRGAYAPCPGRGTIRGRGGARGARALALARSPARSRTPGQRLLSAIHTSYDEAAVQAALDDGLAAFGLETSAGAI